MSLSDPIGKLFALDSASRTTVVKVCSAVLVLVMVTFLFSKWYYGDAKSLREVERIGVITENNVYHNQEVGISMRIPAGWTLGTSEQIAEMDRQAGRVDGEAVTEARLLYVESRVENVSVMCLRTDSFMESNDAFAKSSIESVFDVIGRQGGETTSKVEEARLDGKETLMGTLLRTSNGSTQSSHKVYVVENRGYLIILLVSCYSSLPCDGIAEIERGIDLF